MAPQGKRGWLLFGPYLVATILLITSACSLLTGCKQDSPENQAKPAFSVTGLLQTNLNDLSIFYPRVKTPIPLEWPADHYAHPKYRSEWWYFTGHMSPESSRTSTSLSKQQNLSKPPILGFQFTLFRQRALPPITQKTIHNAWQTPQIYMGHLAITHHQAQRHRAAQRFSREGPGLAGVSDNQRYLHVLDWQIQPTPNGWWPVRISARDQKQQIGINLQLFPLKPVVLQGNLGFSQKSNHPENASMYYSYTRLKAWGSMYWQNQSTTVKGLAWFDHEWSSSSLGANQVGWSWFALQLDNYHELMLYQIRNKQGEISWSDAAMIDESGSRLPLKVSDITIDTLQHWTSSKTGRRYPSQWRITIPRYAIDLDIMPTINDQEMRLALHYWEGAVTLSGSHKGQGYVELTGY
ncbi:lipocalin-like domain-containing protein [Zooshikella ganghwensis]|uniref:Carotenoid 1,2-hydratase n=1 Tax=Zooshikella ganghwensis TaxID=202772 RepID=A0A4V1INC2_9GAMM|nr:lipocalin-like domain-containing protein [Zooshikella ganghwensis]RDH43221.1 carotenoid 1,2-hydratase [Zooshikella ganghwensis]